MNIIHDQLMIKICEKLVPIVLKELKKLRAKEQLINITEPMIYFCLYGQLGILKCNSLTYDEKLKEIGLLINKIIDV